MTLQYSNYEFIIEVGWNLNRPKGVHSQSKEGPACIQLKIGTL